MPEKPRRLTISRLIPTAAICSLAVVLLVTLVHEPARWQAANVLDQREPYRGYLHGFSDGPHVNDARQQLRASELRRMPARQWTEESGQVVAGKVIAFDDQEITLLADETTEIRLPVSRIVEEDQRYLETLQQRLAKVTDASGADGWKYAAISGEIVLLLLLFAIWLSVRNSTVPRDAVVLVFVGLVVCIIAAWRRNEISAARDIAPFLFATGSCNPEVLLEMTAGDPISTASKSLRRPLLFALCTGAAGGFLSALIRIALQAVFGTIAAISSFPERLRAAASRTRMFLRLGVGTLLATVILLAVLLFDNSPDIGGRRFLQSQHALFASLSTFVVLGMFFSITFLVLSTVELIAGRQLFGPGSGSISERMSRGAMVAVPMAIVLVAGLGVPVLHLNRMGYLRFAEIDRGHRAAQKVIDGMAPTFASTEDRIVGPDFELKGKVLICDDSRTDLLWNSRSVLYPTSEEWQDLSSVPLTVFKIRDFRRSGDRAPVKAAVGYWPQRQGLGILALDLPWNDFFRPRANLPVSPELGC